MLIKNERGYIAIFIALVFQILFIFFAMVVNVGLLVHDKINLQNSVDLAAYYAAGKQAEVLNAIAHSNYQIRQAWKLLSWRIRAVGSMANPGHPLLLGPGDSRYNPNPSERMISDNYPVVCAAHSYWQAQDIGSQQNYCKNAFGQESPRFPDPPVVLAPFLPVNFIIRDQLLDLQRTFTDSCRNVGVRNFLLTTLWMKAYKLDVSSRVKVIEDLAANLSQTSQDFKDFEGGSVYEGTQKTFEKNLTVANRGGEFKLINSLGGTQRWLNKIVVTPEIFYLDTVSGGNCASQHKRCWQIPQYGTQSLAENAQYCREPESTNDPMHSTVGFEKNPWVMAYVGVEATVKGRRPFAPFGGAVELTAKAYAQPFGGRIGPWFEAQWPKGSARSSGGGFVDPLLPFRRVEQGSTDDSRERRNVMTPNYSRYPGDTLGLRSELALSILRRALLQKADTRLKAAYWALLSDPTLYTNPKPDVLAWEAVGNPIRPVPGERGPWIRDFEIAGIMPDLFDATYYSVEPQFYQNYIMRPSPYVFSNGVMPRADLGYRANTQYENFNILGQINVGANLYDPNAAFYVIKQPQYLLTAWAPNQESTGSSDFNYEFPDSVFANCKAPFNPEGSQTPGGCLYGGRVGYSVRLVSEDFLRSNEVVDAGGGLKGSADNAP